MTDRSRLVRTRSGAVRGHGSVRIVFGLGAAILAIGIAGCGGSSSNSESSASTAAANTGESAPAKFPKYSIPKGSNSASSVSNKTVGVIVITQASEVFPQEQAAMEAAFKPLGWHMKIADLAGDISKVPADVENLIQSGADAIVLESVEPSFVGKQALAAAKAANVPIIGQLTGVSTEESEGVLTAAVEALTPPPGKAEGEQIVEQFGDGAKVGMIIDQLAHSGKGAQKGLEEGMAGKTDVVAEHQINYAKIAPDVTATTEQWLLQHPDLQVVWCPYDGACVGAGQAVQAQGSEVAVMSMDGTPGAFDLIREGVNYTTWAIPLTYLNWLNTDILVSALSGSEVKPTTIVPMIKVDSSNVPASGTLPEGEIYGEFEKEFEERWGVK